ncbi:MAG: hypothetical protein D6784_06560 [Chloroflexi bacterium]|nr:MAG: hypothetical protein D6784_06560 [Chloroflexota bacterium]
MLYLAKVVELAGIPLASPGRLWLVFGVDTLFALLFAACTYGFWTLRRWGRILFVWTVIPWFAFEVAALFTSGRTYSGLEIGYTVARAFIAGLFSAWYLNIPRVKALFH